MSASRPAAQTATCAECHGVYALRKDGKLRLHHCEPTAVPIVVSLPWCTPPLTANQVRRLHPLREAALRKAALNEARWAIRAARLTPQLVADVVLHWRMPDNRRRDGDGADPTKKVVLDALVLEGVLPDDSWSHVRHSGVTVHPPQPKIPGGMWLEITEPDLAEEAS